MRNDRFLEQNWLDKSLLRWSKAQPNPPALLDGKGTSYSYTELEIATSAIGSELKFQLAKNDSLVAIIMPHGIPCAMSILAMIRSNIVGIVLNSQAPAGQIRKLIDQFGITHVLMLSQQSMRISRSLELKSLLEFKVSKLNMTLFSTHGKLTNTIPENLAWLILTSGSSGARKAVMLSTETLEERAKSECQYFDINRECKSLSSLIYSHDVGFNQLLSHMTAGASLIVYPFIFIQSLVEVLQESKCNSAWGSPYFWKKIMQACEERTMILDHLEFVTVSGGSLSEKEQSQLKDLLPNATIARTFGQTETFRSLYCLQMGRSFSQVVPGVRLELSRSNTDDASELTHSGAGTMLGYWGESQNSTPVAKVATGDLFSLNESGHYTFHGRTDDMLKRFDQRFYASELEQQVSNLDFVEECYVFQSEPRENEIDQDLILCVQTQKDKEVAQRKLITFCRESLALNMTPNIFLICKTFPRLENGKIDKVALQKTDGNKSSNDSDESNDKTQAYPIMPEKTTVDLMTSSLMISLAVGAPLLVSSWLYPVSVLIIVNRMMFLLHLTHEGLHRNIHHKLKKNNFIGSLCGAIVLASFNKYKRLHFRHHIHLNDELKDPDYHLSCDFPQPIRRYFSKQLIAFFTLKTAENYMLYYSSLPDFMQKYKVLRGIGIRPLMAGVAISSALFLPTIFLFYILPLLIYQQYILLIAALQHGPIQLSNDPHRLSRNVLGPKWLLALLMPSGINYHGTHHIRPQVPYYWLERATQEIDEKIWSESYTAALKTLTLQSDR